MMNLFAKGGLSLERLRSFLLFADAGSISRAAGGDAVRGSLISRQLRELEEFFEVELVGRRGKGLVLTEEGIQLATLIREQFGALEDFGNRAKGSSVRLSLAAGNTMLEWVIAPRMTPGLIQGVEFDLHHEQTRESIEHLGSGSRDFAVIREQPMGRQFASAPLGIVTFDLFIPEKFGKPRDLRKALRDLPLALPIGGSLREAILLYAGTLNPSHLGTTGFLNAVASVRAGNYAAILPSIANHALRERIHRIPIPAKIVPPRQMILAWSRRNAATRPAVASAVDCLREHLCWE
jgi:DNA-binding transcriptional LysR family regulator